MTIHVPYAVLCVQGVPGVNIGCMSHRNQRYYCALNRPIFTPLNYPYLGLAAGSIAQILGKTINLLGLADQGFSAKSFRLIGATVAI